MYNNNFHQLNHSYIKRLFEKKMSVKTFSFSSRRFSIFIFYICELNTTTIILITPYHQIFRKCIPTYFIYSLNIGHFALN